jgi:hypothetical protein
MTTLAIRKKLMTYLADADDNKVKALYTLLEKELQQDELSVLTDEHLQILEREREMHINGQSKSYSREEAWQIIKGQREF